MTRIGFHPKTEFKKGHNSERKGKKLEEIYGIEKAAIIREKQSKAHIGHINIINKPKSKESVEKQRNTLKRMYAEGKIKSWNKNLTKETDERMKIISQKLTGRIISEERRIKSIKLLKQNKGKNYEEIYGAEKARTIKAKLSKPRIKLYNLGRVPHNKGKTKQNYEPLKRSSLSHKGKKLSLNHRNQLSDIHKNNWKLGKEKLNSGCITKERRKMMVVPVKDTLIEVKIQNFLRQLGIEFFTHQYIKDIEHGYQCDILINPQPNFMSEKKTIIECDGDYWHGNPFIFPEPNEMQKDKMEKDACRNEELRAQGFEVIRLWENEIDKMCMEEFKILLNLNKIII